MSRKRNYHVVPSGKNWAVRRENSGRASSTHPTQQMAVRAGRKFAVDRKVELVIHRPDGRIRDADSYGNDPFPPRDTKH